MQCVDYDTEAECEEHWIWDASASNGQLKRPCEWFDKKCIPKNIIKITSKKPIKQRNPMKKTNLNGLFPEAKKKIKKIKEIKNKSNEVKSTHRNKKQLSLDSLEQRLTKQNLEQLNKNSVSTTIMRYVNSMKK